MGYFYTCTYQNQEWEVRKTKLPQPKKTILHSLQLDKDNNIWLLTTKGVSYYSQKQGKLKQELTILKNSFVSKMMQDFEGNYWFTTIGDGIYFMPNKEVLTYNTNNSFLKDTQINCLTEDHQNNLLIGTNGNEVLRLNRERQVINTYYLPKGDVECFLFDENTNQIFIENNYLNVFNLGENYPAYRISAGSTPKDIVSYQKDFLAVAAGDGAGIVSKNKKNKNPTVTLRRIRSNTITVDKTNNRIWVGYADGLYYYENGQEHELKTTQNESIIAIDLVFDRDMLWVGTTQQGVLGIKDLQIQKHWTTKDGLLSNFCRVIRPDKNKLWIGSEKGIQILGLKTKQSYIINKKAGLASNEIRDLLLQDSLVWVASNKGLTVFDKSYMPQKAPPPLIHITGFEINDKTQKLQKKYTLPYYQNNIKIDFRGIAFSSLGKFQYKYRMLGLNDTWTLVESVTNFVPFASLPSGKYTFEVKAISSAGIESKKIARISIEIAYPIWQKWWFILLEIFLGILVVSGIFIWRIRAIQRQNRLKLELINANLKALKTQMNPHFIFNSLISIQGFILEENSKDASYYLNKFAKLTRLILEASRQEYISIAEELSILESYLILEQTFTENRFEYDFLIDENIDTKQFEIPPLFIQTFIENAIKHGIAQMKTGGKIQVSFSLENKLILITIVDNGIGRVQSETLKTQKKHRSLATEIMNERIKLLQRTIAKSVRLEIEDVLDENSKVAGTKVKLFLPYQIP